MGKWEAAYAGNCSHTHTRTYYLLLTRTSTFWTSFHAHIFFSAKAHNHYTHIFFLLPGKYTRAQPLSPPDQPTLIHALTHAHAHTPTLSVSRSRTTLPYYDAKRLRSVQRALIFFPPKMYACLVRQVAPPTLLRFDILSF